MKSATMDITCRLWGVQFIGMKGRFCWVKHIWYTRKAARAWVQRLHNHKMTRKDWQSYAVVRVRIVAENTLKTQH